MNEAEIKAAIDGLPTSGSDAASWTFFYEERANKGGNGVLICRFADELATIWEIMASAAECHKLGNLSPWLWMSVSGPGFAPGGCSYLFQGADGNTIPCGDFRGFKEAVEKEKAQEALTVKAKSALTSVVGTPLISDKGWPFGDE